MAELRSLLPYLEQGYTIANVRGESLLKVDSWVEWRHHTWSGRLEAEKVSMSQVSGIKDMWDYGVVFCDQNGKNPFVETELHKIEALIQSGARGARYAPPKEE